MTWLGWVIHLTAGLMTLALLALFGGEQDKARRLPSVTFSLLGAVELVARREPWPVVGAAFEPHGEGGRYAIKTLGGFGLMRHEVDALSAQLTGSESQTVKGYFFSFDHTDVGRSPVTLAQAIKAAEDHSGGKALRANTHRAGDRIEYWVTVPKENGTLQVFVVDGSRTPAAVSPDTADR